MFEVSFVQKDKEGEVVFKTDIICSEEFVGRELGYCLGRTYYRECYTPNHLTVLNAMKDSGVITNEQLSDSLFCNKFLLAMWQDLLQNINLIDNGKRKIVCKIHLQKETIPSEEK